MYLVHNSADVKVLKCHI